MFKKSTAIPLINIFFSIGSINWSFEIKTFVTDCVKKNVSQISDNFFIVTQPVLDMVNTLHRTDERGQE